MIIRISFKDKLFSRKSLKDFTICRRIIQLSAPAITPYHWKQNLSSTPLNMWHFLFYQYLTARLLYNPLSSYGLFTLFVIPPIQIGTSYFNKHVIFGWKLYESFSKQHRYIPIDISKVFFQVQVANIPPITSAAIKIHCKSSFCAVQRNSCQISVLRILGTVWTSRLMISIEMILSMKARYTVMFAI